MNYSFKKCRFINFCFHLVKLPHECLRCSLTYCAHEVATDLKWDPNYANSPRALVCHPKLMLSSFLLLDKKN